jgi:hypothetical protein
VLVSIDSVADKSNTPTGKFVVIIAAGRIICKLWLLRIKHANKIWQFTINIGFLKPKYILIWEEYLRKENTKYLPGRLK